MKKKVTREVEVELEFCNICNEEITKLPFKGERIAIVRGLFKTQDFNAHELCINTVVREAFKPYFASPTTTEKR